MARQKWNKPEDVLALDARGIEAINTNFDRLFTLLTKSPIGSGLLPVDQGGTGLGSFGVGDLLVATAPTTIAGLPDVVGGNVLLSGGVGAAPFYGKVGLQTHVSGVLPIVNGGTGQITAILAFNALSPLTTKGDVLTHDGTNDVRLGVGTDGYALLADSAQPTGIKWGQLLSTHNLLQANVHLDTLTQTRVLGDMVIASSPDVQAISWFEGGVFDFLVGTADANNQKFWFEGGIIDGLFGGTSADDVRWQRLPIGTTGSFLKSTGLVPTWGPIGDVGQITASNQPKVQVYKTTNQTIAPGAGTDDPVQGGTRVTFNAEEFDSDTFHDLVINPSRLTVPAGKGGVYVVVGQLSWQTMTTAVRAAAWIYLNGVRRAITEVSAPSGGLNFSFSVATFLNLAAGDYVELFARQDDATSKSVLGDTADLALSRLGMVKIA